MNSSKVIEYELTRRKMKNIRLRVVAPEGQVKVSAPHRVPHSFINDFVQQKANWIAQQQQAIRALPAAQIADENACRVALKERVPPLIDYWQAQLGVHCNGFRVRKMHTRWGSCNIRTGWINLSLILGAAEHELLEYIVVHELVHLHERYHNAHFYSWMARMLPDWKAREAKLRALNLRFQ